MRKFAALILIAILAGCAPSLSRASINDLPDEYSAKVTPKHIKTYFDLYPPLDGEKYGKITMAKDSVSVEILTSLFETRIGTVTVSIVDGASGRVLDINCSAERPSGWVYIERDSAFWKKDISLFLIGGKR